MKHFCLTLFVWLTLLSICKPRNELPGMFYSAETQSKVYFVSYGHLFKPFKHPNLPLTLLARTGLILVQRTFLALLMIQLSNDVQLNPGPDVSYSPHNFSLPNKGLRVCHWNVRSYNNTKYEEIRTVLTDERTQLDILIITESWLDNTVTDSEINIPGYNIERKDREEKNGGGVLMYISNEITYSRASTYESRTSKITLKSHLSNPTVRSSLLVSIVLSLLLIGTSSWKTPWNGCIILIKKSCSLET